MPDVTDGQLVHQTQSGDHDAYRQLVARYQGHVYGLAYSLVGDWTQAQDIAQAGTFTDDERSGMFHPNWWNFCSLEDARWAAVRFLKDSAAVLEGEAAEAVKRAAALYEQEAKLLTSVLEAKDAFLGGGSGKDIKAWTDDVRQREQEILSQGREIESAAIAEIENALAAMEA